MAKVYKVWGVVEEFDEAQDSYEDVSEPAMLAEFETQEEAQDFLNKLDTYPS